MEIFFFFLYNEAENKKAEDTTKKSRFPVAKTSIETYEDLYKSSPADLKTPENVRSVFEYDPVTQCYVVRTKVGDMEVSTPFMLTPEEYKDYSLRKSIEAYYREKNKEITRLRRLEVIDIGERVVFSFSRY